MSTVSNPYKFNIKSNCGFSTNALISDNQAKITMKYSYNDYSDDIEVEAGEFITRYYTIEELEYYSAENTGNMVPSVINGNNIVRIGCYFEYGDLNGHSCIVFTKDSQQYSKIILNGGPFKNCSIPYDGDTNVNGIQRYYIESRNPIPGIDYTNWGQYNNVPFDLTIKFV